MDKRSKSKEDRANQWRDDLLRQFCASREIGALRRKLEHVTAELTMFRHRTNVCIHCGYPRETYCICASATIAETDEVLLRARAFLRVHHRAPETLLSDNELLERSKHDRSMRAKVDVQQSRIASGTANELYVCPDLLLRGIWPYWRISFDSPVDIIALYRGVMLRVEVKTALGGNVDRPAFPVTDDRKMDILALVFPGGDVRYFRDKKWFDWTAWKKKVDQSMTTTKSVPRPPSILCPDWEPTPNLPPGSKRCRLYVDQPAGSPGGCQMETRLVCEEWTRRFPFTPVSVPAGLRAEQAKNLADETRHHLPIHAPQAEHRGSQVYELLGALADALGQPAPAPPVADLLQPPAGRGPSPAPSSPPDASHGFLTPSEPKKLKARDVARATQEALAPVPAAFRALHAASDNARPISGTPPWVEPAFASLAATGAEVTLDGGPLGTMTLVPAYTGKDRLELTFEHASLIRLVADCFPGSSVTGIRRPSQDAVVTAVEEDEPDRVYANDPDVCAACGCKSPHSLFDKPCIQCGARKGPPDPLRDLLEGC
jgi:hypothetical protein